VFRFVFTNTDNISLPFLAQVINKSFFIELVDKAYAHCF